MNCLELEDGKAVISVTRKPRPYVNRKTEAFVKARKVSNGGHKAGVEAAHAVNPQAAVAIGPEATVT